jgi:hypothetical protein
MEPEQGQEQFVNPLYVVVALAAVFIGVTGLFVWLGSSWYAEYNELAQPTANLGRKTQSSLIVTSAAAGTPGIGSELYDAATETVPPVPNPVSDIYKNPFE